MGALRGLVKGVCWGAALMYLFDPDRGRTRRTRCRDQALHWVRYCGHSLETAARDLNNRWLGFVAEVSAGSDTREVPDETLVARVCAKLGRAVRQPKAIQVSAEAGRVTLRGPVLADEVEQAVHEVSRIAGVVAVENELEVQEDASGAAGLEQVKPRIAGGLLNGAWTPAVQVVVTAAAATVVLRYTARHMPLTLAAGVGLAAAVLATDGAAARPERPPSVPR